MSSVTRPSVSTAGTVSATGAKSATGVITGQDDGVEGSPARDVIVNDGSITGGNTSAGVGIKFQAGEDQLTNSGIITAGSSGIAVDMGADNDSATYQTGSQITGITEGGTGTDTLVFEGEGREGEER